jgi:hypothetical protein
MPSVWKRILTTSSGATTSRDAIPATAPEIKLSAAVGLRTTARFCSAAGVCGIEECVERHAAMKWLLATAVVICREHEYDNNAEAERTDHWGRI